MGRTWKHLTGPPGTTGLWPGASDQIRSLWLCGFSSFRISATLDIPVTTVVIEARRLDLPCRCRRRQCPRHGKRAGAAS
jgi:hypothetical protein